MKTSDIKLHYPHPPLPTKPQWFYLERDGAPIFMNAYLQLWTLREYKKYYRFQVSYPDGYWFYKKNRTAAQLNVLLSGYTMLDYFLIQKNFKTYLKNWGATKKLTLQFWNRYSREKIKKLYEGELIVCLNTANQLLKDIYGYAPQAGLIGEMAIDYTNWWMDNHAVTDSERKKGLYLLFCSDQISETAKRQVAISTYLQKTTKALRPQAIQKLLKKYSYAKSNFGGYNSYTEADIMNDYEAAAHSTFTNETEDKEALLKKYKATAIERAIFKQFAYYTFLRDERRAYEQRPIAIMDWVVEELAQRFSIPHPWLRFALVKEVKPAKLSNPLFLDMLKKRYETGFLAYWRDEKKGSLVTGEEAEKIFHQANKERELQKDLKGFSTYYGKVTGKVVIINSPRDPIPKEPFVLVTSMTSPDYVQYFKNCIAIVTDEGGITCHAAIISRELRKPCIVGTQLATKLLKNGVIVEVNANDGIVKLL